MNLLRYMLSPKLFMTALGVVVAGIAGYGLLNSGVLALPQDCDESAIIKCGFQDKAGFKTGFNANAKGDVKTVYADERFGFTADEMDRFMQTAVWATAYKDGPLVLDDGRVVATNTWSPGRTSAGGANPHTMSIAGKTYYWGYNRTAFAANSIRTLVMMDKNNKYMEFAVISSCGNPITGTKPVFQCEMLNKKEISNTKYEFWTTATAKNGASVKNVVYNFGDGKTETKTSATEHVTHTYAKPGNYTVTVTVTYNVNGKEQKETVQTKCKTAITVKEEVKPVFACKSLTFKAITRTRFEFVAKGESDKATFKTAKFDFGDGKTAENLQANVQGQAETVRTEHEYAKEGNYTIKAFLTYDKGTTKETQACIVKVMVKPKTCEDTPNAPECQPPKEETCITNPELPGCKILPATGPMDILVSALGIGSVTGAGLYYVGTRRNLMDTLLKR